VLAAVLPPSIFSDAVDLLTDLCRISSPSGDGEGLRAVAERLSVELGRRGLQTDITMEPPGSRHAQPVLCARGPAADDRYVLVLSHLDTVLPAVAPRLDTGRLVATGAVDTKGGLVALVGALDLLSARGGRPPADLFLLAVPDEEAGGAVSTAAVGRWGPSARTLLVLEPGERRGEAETLVAGRRGLTEWRLDVRGRSAHSGLAYWEGRSALAAAAKWCAWAQRLSSPGAGITVNAARLVAGDADFVDRLPERAGLLGSSNRRNVVADRAVAEGEVRYLTHADGENALAELEEMARHIEREEEVEVGFARGAQVPPVEAQGAGAALVRRAVELALARGWELQVEDDRGGVSFPNYIAGVGTIPTLDGLGPVGGGMHTREEYVDLGSLRRRIVLLADLLENL
jgi:glutamate carboxypeptidase